MNIATLMDELGTALGQVPNLRIYPYYAESVTPPAAVIGWPDPLTYDATFGRGSDKLTLPIYVVMGAVDARASRDRLADCLTGSGESSVKAACEAGAYTDAESVRVTEASVEVLTIAGVDYLAGVFQVECVGPGVPRDAWTP